MIAKLKLQKMYEQEFLSVPEIANRLSFSEGKVNYWLKKHEIPKRSISAALYQAHNPAGDPFYFSAPHTSEQWFLYGIGMGLYWGEGNKANPTAVRLGNTDPALIKMFLHFLTNVYNIDESRLRFGLQVFSDMSAQKAKSFWINHLKVSESQFQKVTVTPSKKKGTYKNKSQYGVLTVYFSNTKLRAMILAAILELRTKANVAQSVERVHGKSQ